MGITRYLKSLFNWRNTSRDKYYLLVSEIEKFLELSTPNTEPYPENEVELIEMLTQKVRALRKAQFSPHEGISVVMDTRHKSESGSATIFTDTFSDSSPSKESDNKLIKEVELLQAEIENLKKQSQELQVELNSAQNKSIAEIINRENPVNNEQNTALNKARDAAFDVVDAVYRFSSSDDDPMPLEKRFLFILHHMEKLIGALEGNIIKDTNSKFDELRHEIVEVVETDNDELNMIIKDSVMLGFEVQGTVVRPQRVCIYKTKTQ